MAGRASRRTFVAGTAALGLLRGSGAARADGAPRRGGTLVATWGGGEPQACYVPSGGGFSPLFSASKLLERLAAHRADGRFEGVLAESWRPAADFRSWTVKLRRDVRFHDGAPLGVEDVVYSIDEIWKKHGAIEAMATHVATTAPDRETVELRFAKPVPEFFFASLLAGPASFIVPRHVYAGSDPATNPANNAPVGTGPWKFEAWVRGSHFAFVRNEAYWRPGQPWLDRLVLRYVRDPAGRTVAFEAGDIQLGVSNPVPLPDLKRLAATGRFVATTKGYEDAAWSTTLECNVRRPPFARKEVRQAMFFAIDRSLMARTVFQGYARPGGGPISSSNAEYFSRDTVAIPYDPRKAASLLDAAGQPKKADGRRFALTLVAAGWFPENGRVGAVVKQALEEIGIGVTLVVPDRATSIRRLYTDYDFDLAISNHLDPPEPVPTTTRCYTEEGLRKGVPFRNASGFHSAEVDALVERIAVETDAAQRRSLVAAFQKIVSVEAPALPLVELDTTTLADGRLRNHSTDPDFPLASWHDLWMDA